MKTERAWSTFEVKTVDEDARIIEGVATTPSTDRMGDVVEPMGAEFELPLPFLWQHDSRQPLGHVTKAKVTKDGITVTVKVMKIEESGRLKQRLDEAWQSIKHGLVRGLSIGFRAKETAFIRETGGVHFLKWVWLELSAVTIAANQDASIQAIKAVDLDALKAATGQQREHRVVRLDKLPGATGSKAALNLKTGEVDMLKKPLAEQLAAFEAKRAASVARMEELMSKAAEEGRSLDASEAEEHDNLAAEVKSVDEHIKRLKDLESISAKAASAATVITPGTQNAAGAAAPGGVIQVRSNLPKGTAFTRFAMALARAKGNVMQAVEIAQRWKDTTPEVVTALKASVDPGTTTDSAWAAPLVDVQQMADEFIELLRPATILGRMQGLRRVPFNVKMPRQLTGSTANWVGQGQPKPVSRLTFDTVTLGFAKVAGIVVITEELARLSSPAAEAVVRQDMIDTISQFQDVAFIDTAAAAVPNVSPASITNGVVAVPSTGYTVSNVQADVRSVMNNYIAANINLATGVWIMHPRTALSLSLLRSTSEDTMAFPGITPQGGTFMGLPVITSANVPVAATTGDPTIIVLANASDILMADDGGITVDVSREASLQMDDAPDTGAQQLVSLWQNNLVGMRAERMINWHKRRAAAVQVISGVTY